MPWHGSAGWVLALSGGCDSRLLLDLLVEIRDGSVEPLPPLRALHIDHAIHPESAQWAAQCRAWCEQYGVEFESQQVQLRGRRQGLEARARDARYRVFESQLQAGEVLLMAHHRDDQAETFLLRLLRGAGPAGLSAMPVQRSLGAGQLFRPLLGLSRVEIEREAVARELDWIEDPSNADRRFDRNFLRRELLPALAKRWPDYSLRLEKAAALQADTNALLAEYVQQDLARLLGDDGGLDLAGLKGFSSVRQLAVLRGFLKRHHANPTLSNLRQLRQQCFAAEDRQPQWQCQGMVCRRHRDRLFCCKEAAIESQEVGESIVWIDFPQPLQLLAGTLSAEPGGRFQPTGTVSIRWRKEGMRCQLAGDVHSRSLKKLMQQWAVPRWLRTTTPLIYCDERLAAIADLAICEGFEQEQGWQLHWQPNSE